MSVDITKLCSIGGCSAKVSRGDLHAILEGLTVPSEGDLLVGDDTGDDAAVYRLSSDTAIVFTVDILTPLVSDPFLYGRVAAANSISDIYAMGGKPLLALNVCCFPEENVPRETLNEILKGGMDVARRAGCLVVGGHTIKDRELKYGMAVVGTVHPDRVKRNSTARVGDALLLTKPLGSGVIVHAAREDASLQPALRSVCASMTDLNDRAAQVAVEHHASAMTDVTGFGLGGHALGMARGARVGLRFQGRALPTFPESLDLIRRGVRMGLTVKNGEALMGALRFGPDVPLEIGALLCDPQTAGGLLMAVPPERAGAALADLRDRGYAHAAIVGEVYATASGAGEIEVVW